MKGSNMDENSNEQGQDTSNAEGGPNPAPATRAAARPLDATDDVLQFLRNRDVIEYKVDPRSIPSDLLDQYYLSIPAAACEAIALSFFEGK
jgi:hypothetical protein